MSIIEQPTPSKVHPVKRAAIGAVRSLERFSPETLVMLGLFVGLLVGVAILLRPWFTPGIGPDSSASVLYFDRLTAGQPLEAFVGVTPKPGITLLYGLEFNAFHDWRTIAAGAAIEFAVMLTAAAALAWRTKGPVAAGMTAVGLLGTKLILLDAALTYANPWAILFWLLAGLALTARSPRYGLAGAFLFVAALMRIETFIIIAAGAAALAAWRFAPVKWVPGSSRPPARAILLLVGVAALPVMVVHDWLLTGNGFFWLDVSSILSKAAPASVESPLQLAQDLVAHYIPAWPLALLAVAGVADMVRRRRVVVLLGLLACGPGVLAFLELLAFKNTYVSNRYTIPADAALVFAAAVGAEVLVLAVARRVGRLRQLAPTATQIAAGGRARDRLTVAGGAVVIGAIVAVACIHPYGPLDHETWTAIDKYRALQGNYESVKPTIVAALAALPDKPVWSVADVEKVHGGPTPRLYAPGLLWPRLAVDLGLPVWEVRDGSPVLGDAANLRVTIRSIVYLDTRQGTDPVGDDTPLEVSAPTRVGFVLVTPLVARPADGLWVLELDPLTD